MHVCALTRYGAKAASTRQRFLQYGEHLKKEGVDLTIFPLLDDKYLDVTYRGGRPNRTWLARQYLNRAANIAKILKSSDVVWVYCESFPYLPSVFERAIFATRSSVIFDFDDAIFHKYDMHPNLLIRSALSEKLKPLIARSARCFCGNRYLLDYAAQWNAECTIVPTVVDCEHFAPAKEMRVSRRCAVGWIGTPSTWQEYMAPILPMLAELSRRLNLDMYALGAEISNAAGSNVRHVVWGEDKEVPFLRSLDIGIMPLNDSPWARGKCGYKLIQYMAVGLPVIASPVGVNTEIVDHGVNGFLAATPEDWRSAIATLAADPGLRTRMGRAGRKKVEEQYSLQTWGPRVARMIREIAVGTS